MIPHQNDPPFHRAVVTRQTRHLGGSALFRTLAGRRLATSDSYAVCNAEERAICIQVLFGYFEIVYSLGLCLIGFGT